jgi:hypothetical protein
MVHFVFLEFLDPRVEGTLRALRDALQPWKKSLSPVHVTVRGPYRSEPDSENLRELGRSIRGQGVRIIGAGQFSNDGRHSVFLRAESAVFRTVWWKPDFPTSLDDIQPHLTMFESSDRTSALMALNFLKASRISILTFSVQLSVYTPGQGDLFGTRPVDPVPPNVGIRRDIVAIDPEVLPAATDLGHRLAARRAELSLGGANKA